MINKIKQFFKQKHSQKIWQLVINQDRRNFLLVFALFIIVTVAFFAVFKINSKARAGWWNDTWQYRKKISVGSGSSAISDYQVKIDNYNTSTDISANKMQTNCGDIRFTSEQGVELPYWIESGCNTSTTDIWVKVDNIPSTGGTDIYMYYGNPSATNGSNEDNTFIFADDFEENDQNKWLNSYATSSTTVLQKTTTQAYAGNYAGEAYQTVDDGDTAFFISQASLTSSGEGDRILEGQFYDTSSVTSSSIILENGAIYFGVMTGTSTTHYSYSCGWGAWTATTKARSTDWHRIKYVYSGTTGYLYIDGTLYATCSSLSSGNNIFYGTYWTASSGFYLDNVFMRKYLATEPTVGTPSSEEQTVSPIAYYSFDEGYGTTVHNQMEKNGEHGLTSYYKLDEGADNGCTGGSNDICDEKGLNDGTNSSGIWATGHVGSALITNGSSTYFQIPDKDGANDFDYDENFTVSFWVKTTATVNTAAIVEKWAGTTAYPFVFRTTGSNYLYFMRYDLTNGPAVTSQTVINDGSWHHIVGKKEGSYIYLYVDGALQNSALDTTTTTTTNTSPVYIGSRGGSSNYWLGALDELKFYNRALSASEIVAEYSSLHSHMISMDEATDWVEGTRQNPQQRPLGKALDFDGTDDKAIIPVSESIKFSGTTPFTISAWIKPDSTTAGMIVSKYNFSVSGEFYFTLDSGKIQLLREVSPFSITGNTTIPTGVWTHVIALYDGTNMKLYVNGKEDATPVSSGSITGIDMATYIGAGLSSSSYAYHFDGQIDELKIYKKALTLDQIKTVYNRGAGTVMGAGTHAGAGAPPKGFWKLDEGSGFSAFDSSGNNNTGILTNMDTSSNWVAGKVGKALDFDGTNDYITIADNSSIGVTSALTVSSWINPDVTIGDDATTRWLEKGDNYFLLESTIDCSDGNSTNPGITFLVKQANTNQCVKTTQQIQSGEWHHVTGTYDGANLKIYIDGILLNTKALTGSIDDDNLPLIIGSDDSFTTYYFNGKIDHVKVYDYARTPEQIHYDMATGSPVAHFSFDEGAGTTVHNSQEKNGENGLVSWWKFDTASSGTITTAYDEKSVNNGTGSNAIYSTTAKIGNAGYFDGTGDYITVTDNDTLDLTNITISAWIRPSAVSGQATIVGKRDSGSATINYAFRTYNDEIEFYWKNSTDQIYTTSSTNLAINTWYHVAATYDGSSVKLYKNGVLQTGSCTTGTCNNALLTSSDNFGIGWSGEMASEYWNGYLDSVKLYNRALGATEILADYNSVHGHMMYMDPATDWVEGAKQNPQQRELGKALDFDGSNDRVHVPYNSNLNFSGRAAFTISAWINPKVNNAYGSIVSQSDGTTNTYVLAMNASGRIEAGRIIAATGNTVIPTNKWTHVVFTYDGTYINVYVNTKDDATLTSDVNNAGSSDDLLIGAWNYTNPSVFFNGSIDEVKIYNYALTANEVKTEYNRGAAVVLGAGKSDSDSAQDALLGWWKFDEGSGFSMMDSSGNNNTALFKNATNTTTLWGPGKLGKAAYFEGGTVYAEANNETNFDFERTDPFSISFWFNPSSSYTYAFPGIFYKQSSSIGYQIWYENVNEYMRFDIQSGSTYRIQVATATGTMRKDTWQHVVATYDGSSNASGTRIYVNGISMPLTIVDNDLGTNSILNDQAPRIGLGSGFDWFKGYLDNLKVYSKELSSAEVAWEYNQGNPIYHWDFNDGQGIIATNAQSKSVTTDGLVGFWTMDSTTINDMSGNGNNLTNSGSPTSVTGIKGNAIDYLASSSQYSYCSDANCGGDLDYQGNGLTISTWVLADSANATKQLTGKHYYTSSTDNGGYLLYTDSDSTFKFILRNSVGTSTQVDLDSAVTASTTAWQHVVGTYDGITAKIYVNGILKSSSSYSSGIMDTTGNFGIATHGDGNATYLWDGKIDHTKVWQRALSAQEVAIEYGNDEKYGYLTNMDASTDWVDGAWPASNRPKLGKGLDFDGTDDYITVPDTNALDFGTNPFSVTGWFKTNRSGTFQVLVSKVNSGANNGWDIRFNTDNTLNFTIDDGGMGGSGAVSTTLVNDNNWHHFAAVRADTINTYLYIDGKLEGTGSANSNDVSGTENLEIGSRYSTHAGSLWLGQIDEIKIYNYGLTANQVKLDYNNSAAVRY